MGRHQREAEARREVGARADATVAQQTAAAGVERANVLGCSIDRLDMAQTVARIEAIIASGGFAQHAAVNAAKIVAMHDDGELRRIIERCELVSADGQAVVWTSRLLRDPLPSRVAGIDLMQHLLALAERRGYRVYLLGAKTEVLQRAVERLHERHPRLAIAGTHHGYFADADAAAVAAEVATCRPDIVFVAMPSPRKEYWLARHGRTLGASFVMGVGGSVDVLAGQVRRAPVPMQRLGLEWLFRLAQEPGRLSRRYLTTNVRFIVLVLRELGRRAARPARGQNSGSG